MPPIATILLVLITGILAGYFGAYYRSRGDVDLVRTQVDAHLNLALRQHEAQLEAVRQADIQQRLASAYDQLGVWLHQLERATDEVWFGCSNTDAAVRHRAQHLIDKWPWETLRVPAEARSAEFYWSGSVRKEIRRFEGETVEFITNARIAISSNHLEQDFMERQAAVWASRGKLRAVIDSIRDRVRVDLVSRVVD